MTYTTGCIIYEQETYKKSNDHFKEDRFIAMRFYLFFSFRVFSVFEGDTLWNRPDDPPAN